MWINPQFSANLVTFTEKILNVKLQADDEFGSLVICNIICLGTFTFATLNKLFPLSKDSLTHTVLNWKHQAGWNNQNLMQNTYLFHILFQLLMVFPKKIIRYSYIRILLFLVVLHQVLHFFIIFIVF